MSGIENVPLQNKSSALSCSELWMSGTFVKSFHSQILCVLQIWPSVIDYAHVRSNAVWWW